MMSGLKRRAGLREQVFNRMDQIANADAGPDTPRVMPKMMTGPNLDPAPAPTAPTPQVAEPVQRRGKAAAMGSGLLRRSR